MNIEQWLDQYGYWAVFLGVFLEGPLTLTLAGFLAHQGYLNSLGVLLTAFVSVFLVIEVFFFIGLLAGRHIMERRPKWRKQSSRLSGLLERYQTIFLLGFCFVYGAHTISPIVVGISGIKPGYFTIMNAAGSVLWTLVMFLIGYFFSHAYGMVIDDVKRYEKPIALVLVAIVIIYYIARRLIWRKVSAEKP
jgi:membrane protein DedA with SNARE-associated domain